MWRPSQVVGRLGAKLSSDAFHNFSQKSPAGADFASSRHVEAPVERGSVESQLESGPANRKGRLSGQGLSKDGM